MTVQVGQALSQDLLLLPSDGRSGPAHIENSIRELMKLSYRLDGLSQGMGAELVGGVRITRLAAHAMQLLLAIQLDVDTKQRWYNNYFTYTHYTYMPCLTIEA